MDNTYEKLLQLPLFLGMSKEEVTDLVGWTKLDFHKCAAGEIVAEEHAPCRGLVFLQQGMVMVEKQADNHAYKVQERLEAPAVIEPERLFGLYQRYARTYHAAEECHLISIDKPAVMNICHRHTIFFLNLLGLVATAEQRLAGRPWHDKPMGTELRMVHFLQERVLTPSGTKAFFIKMQTLAVAIGESRLNVSRVLNRWQDEGLVNLSRGRIDIPSFERLLL